jgi:hypothetical protein
MGDGTDRLHADRRRAFEVASAIDDPTERLLEAAAVVAEELAEIGRAPIIIGGLAVAYWAQGVETTEDIDVAMPDHPRLDEHLELLGLHKEGRVWATEDRRIVWERPADTLPVGWSAVTAELRSTRSIRVISLEDAIVDRMHSLDSTGDIDSFNRTLTLLGASGVDRERLGQRASVEGLADVLQRVEEAAAKVAEGHGFEAHEVHDLFGSFGHGSTM